MVDLLVGLVLSAVCLLACLVIILKVSKRSSTDRQTLIVLGSGLSTSCTMLTLLKGRSPSNAASTSFSTVYLIPAGGHTAEMLTLQKAIGHKAGSSRAYVVASTDKLSAEKAERLERGFANSVIAPDRKGWLSYI